MFPGRTIADRYRVLRVLGRGGMGVVSEVEAVATGQHFAIKFLRDDVESDVQPNARFVREAKLATRLTSPHACRVTEIGEWELGPFIVMELLEGRSLSAILEDKVVLSWQAVVRIAYEMCDALGEAHGRGIVHRDVKPGNVFIAKSPAGCAITKMLDFGVAKIPVSVVTAHGERSLTDASTLLGTPSYVAPEQLMNSKLVDARADIWAVGVLMYEMLGGRLPFSSPLLPKLLVMIARDEPAPLSTLVSEVPPELVQIVHACLQKKPAQRFADAATLARALEPWLDRTRDLLDPLLQPPSRQMSLGPSGPPATLPPLCEATQAEPPHRTDPAPLAGGGDRSEPNPAFSSGEHGMMARRRRTRLRWLLLGSAVGVLLGVLKLVSEADRRPERALSDVPRLPSASAPVVPVRSVLVLVDPAQARIEFDQRKLPDNPAQLSAPDDGREHELVLSAPGYRSEKRTLRFDNDQQLSLALTKEDAPARNTHERPRSTSRPPALPRHEPTRASPTSTTRQLDENPF